MILVTDPPEPLIDVTRHLVGHDSDRHKHLYRGSWRNSALPMILLATPRRVTAYYPPISLLN